MSVCVFTYPVLSPQLIPTAGAKAQPSSCRANVSPLDSIWFTESLQRERHKEMKVRRDVEEEEWD